LPDPIDRLGTALSDRYRIERELGRGGMAIVYLAEDLKHRRKVALKVLEPELAQAIGHERFLKEIEIAAQLNHPHILPLHDSGEADGLLYYVMPYVEGETLRHRLSREKQLPLEDTLQILEDVADALSYAHSLGVIHRDIKPENILFSEGHAIVADFGIAKAVSSAGREQLTRSGFPLGTPGYMSPEQASGQTSLDPRTDVCGLGCVAYEMLIGDTPGVWSTPDEVRLGRFAESLPGHREHLDKLPGRVEQVLVKALAIRSAERFETPVEFAEALASASQGSARLSDEETRAVIERAAELDAGVPTEGGALSIGGVEQVAAQVGIPPDRVRRAARDLQQTASQRLPARLATEGSKRKSDLTVIEWSIAGELSASAHPRLVEEIHTTMGVAGHATQLGSSLTWSPAAEGVSGRRMVVTVNAGDGRTRIRVEEKYSLTEWKLLMPGWGAAVGALAAAGLFAGLLGMSEAPGIIAPVLVGGFGGGILAATGILKASSSRRRPRLEQLADRLTDIAAGSIVAAKEREGEAEPRQLSLG
jgi:serine/threonine protein kinase